MRQSVNSKQTIYGEFVEGQVKEIARAGGGVFTFLEIAEKLGIKPTHNLRKRLRTLERWRHLEISYAYVGKCGTCLIYTIADWSRSENDLSDIPF